MQDIGREFYKYQLQNTIKAAYIQTEDTAATLYCPLAKYIKTFRP
jgi:hypothetical protein